jgi:hypothetical protein
MRYSRRRPRQLDPRVIAALITTIGRVAVEVIDRLLR